MEKGGKALSPSEWEQVFSDFATSEALQQQWLGAYPAQALLELALNIIAKERGADFSLKQQLLVFLEEHGALLIGADVSAGLGRVSGALKTLLPTAGNSAPLTQTALTQVISLAAGLAVQTESQESAPGQLEALVDVFLTVVSRVNSLPDRQVRGAACEALRALERAFPCLLHLTLGHLLGFCQAERTHVTQSYILLFLEVLEHAAVHLFRSGGEKRAEEKRGGLAALSDHFTSWVPSYFRSGGDHGVAPLQGGQKPGIDGPPYRRTSSGAASALLSTLTPLTPFTLPPFLSATKPSPGFAKQELSEGTLREFRRAVSFVLENTGVLSEPATAQVVSSLIRIVSALQLPVSIFKHHFAGLIHSSSPVLVHTALQVYLHFPDAYADASERAVLLERLGDLANDSQQPLSARLLSLHWLLAIATSTETPAKPPPFLPLLQPSLFDPLAVKASKLEALAATSTPPVTLSRSQAAQKESPNLPERSVPVKAPSANAPLFVAADFEAGSATSLEAAVAFRSLHRFITSQDPPTFSQVSGVPDNPESKPTSGQNPQTSSDGPVLQQIGAHLVSIAFQHPPQIPNILALLQRLLQSGTHSQSGVYLLQTQETALLPQLKPSRTLPAYFPLLQEMVAHGQGDPKPLLNLLVGYCVKWASAAGSETGFASQAWVRGTEVLEVCRSVMLVQPRGKILEPLREVLDIVAGRFPDIEVQDSARLYLSLLVNLSEERFRSMLTRGETGGNDSAMLLRATSVSPSNAEPPEIPEVASYILLERLSEPLAAQAWAVNRALDVGPAETPATMSERADQIDGAKAIAFREPDAGRAIETRGVRWQSQGGPLADGNARREKTGRALQEALIKKRKSVSGGEAFSEGGSELRNVGEESATGSVLERYQQELERGPGESGRVCIPCSLRYLGRPEGKGHARTEKVVDRGVLVTTGLDDQATEVGGAARRGHVAAVAEGNKGAGQGTEAREGQRGADLEGGESEEILTDGKLGMNAPSAIFAAVLSFSTSEEYEPIPSVHVPFLCEESDGPEGGGEFRQEAVPPEVVEIELRPRQPTPAEVETWIEFTDESAQAVSGRLQTVHVAFEDLFKEAPTPADVADPVTWQAALFDALWAQLGPSDATAGLRASEKEAAAEGAQSVKLLEVEAEVVVGAVEQLLGRFVTGVTGERLVEIVREGAIITGARFDVPEQASGSPQEVVDNGSPRLQLEWGKDEEKGRRSGGGGALGSFQVLVFLPPRYHLLLSVVVSDWSSLAHIRTDFWPCLEHVDEFLEALVGVA